MMRRNEDTKLVEKGWGYATPLSNTDDTDAVTIMRDLNSILTESDKTTYRYKK